jgi:5'-nucleotidase (lipoprotein e(P4) family)
VKRLYRWPSSTLVCLLFAACSQQPVAPVTHESLNAGLWTQTAAEYAASTMQAYRTAIDNLDRALSDSNWTAALEQQNLSAGMPPIVLMDIDQTVLDNSGYNTQLILAGKSHTRADFKRWCEYQAPVVPGAREFTDYAGSRGVTIVYYSARHESLRDCTRRNLLSLGLPLPDDALLLLNDGTAATRKAQQRHALAARYRILLIVGDNLDDFVDGSRAGPDTRRALARRYESRWGRSWIILPNPVYGDWESSIYEFDYTLPREERINRKLRYLSK